MFQCVGGRKKIKMLVLLYFFEYCMENIWMEKVFLGRWVVPCLDFPGVFWRIL
jgi:hypothetical protein